MTDLSKLKSLALAAKLADGYDYVSAHSVHQEFIAACSPDVVVKLVEALEKAQHTIKESEHALTRLRPPHQVSWNYNHEWFEEVHDKARAWLEKWGAK